MNTQWRKQRSEVTAAIEAKNGQLFEDMAALQSSLLCSLFLKNVKAG